MHLSYHMSGIFAGCKGWDRENLLTGGYKMAAIVSQSDFHLFVIKFDNNP